MEKHTGKNVNLLVSNIQPGQQNTEHGHCTPSVETRTKFHISTWTTVAGPWLLGGICQSCRFFVVFGAGGTRPSPR